jgi:hypothetical protein
VVEGQIRSAWRLPRSPLNDRDVQTLLECREQKGAVVGDA